VINQYSIALAESGDDMAIANLSRDAIEHGLVWRWTPARIRRAMASRTTNVVVARGSLSLIGFALMQYGDNDAHLILLAVSASYRRQHVAVSLMNWFEPTFAIAGIERIKADVRQSNHVARAFYRALGFRETGVTEHYYQGREHAVHLLRERQG
jgi:ribosomal-protein-alanine N-acetyltransferase